MKKKKKTTKKQTKKTIRKKSNDKKKRTKKTKKKTMKKVQEEFLEPIRVRRKEYEQNIPAVYEMLKQGSMVARAEAAKTLDEVRAAMKINYFDDEALIQSHVEKFNQN